MSSLAIVPVKQVTLYNTNMTLGRRIIEARKMRGISQSELARAIGVSRPAVSQWESDKTEPTRERLLKIAAVTKVNALWLATGEGPIEDTAPHLTRVAIISCVQAGEWSPVHDDHPPGDGFDYITTDLDLSDGAFALEIKGDSMLPDFRPGDRVIIDPAVEPRPGDFVVAKLNSEQEATFKKYRVRAPGVIELVPLNDDYPTLTIGSEHPGRIVGVMVEHRRYRR